MRQRLIDAGYLLVDTVQEHGEFAIRGALIDLFPMGSATPYRIDLFDDEIETLRTFDPETQRSIDRIDRIRLLPAREHPFDQESISRFKQRWRETFDVDYTRCPVYQDIASGIAPAGIEYYLPLFFEHSCATLFDYLPDNLLLIEQDGLHNAATQFWQEVQSRYQERAFDVQRPVLPPEQLFLPPDQLAQALHRYPTLRLQEAAEAVRPGRDNLPCAQPPALTAAAGASDPLAPLAELSRNSGQPLLICAESAGRREALLELGRRAGLQLREYSGWHAFASNPAPLGITIYPLELGLNLVDSLQVVTETQLFGQQVFQRRRRQREQSDSDPGDPSPVGTGDRRPGGPHRPRGGSLPGAANHRDRRRGERISHPGVRQQRSALCAGLLAAPDQPLFRRRG